MTLLTLPRQLEQNRLPLIESLEIAACGWDPLLSCTPPAGDRLDCDSDPSHD